MEQSLDQLSLLMRNNLPEETGDIQRDLTENISELRDTVEEAAEKIIGNDEDAMRFAADQLDDLREEVQREMENALNQQRQGEPQGGREQQGNEPNPPAKREEKTAKASRVRAKRNPRRVSPGKTSSAAADRASQANRRSLVKAKDVAKRMSRRNNPERQGGQGQQPREGEPQEGQPNGQPRPGQGQGQAKNPTSSRPPDSTGAGRTATESERPE